MSLSPVTGTEVSETANGVVTPVPSENGPHVPVSVKCGGSRVPCSGDPSEDRALVHTENHIDLESRVYDGEGRSEMYNNEETSRLPSHTSHVIDASLPAAMFTGDSESGSRDTVFPEDSNTVKPPNAALLTDSALSKGPVTTCRQQTEAETVDGGPDSLEEEEEDGEKEKQDEEEDEKNEKKWIHQRAGGRTELEVSGLLNYFQLYYIMCTRESAGHHGNSQQM